MLGCRVVCSEGFNEVHGLHQHSRHCQGIVQEDGTSSWYVPKFNELSVVYLHYYSHSPFQGARNSVCCSPQHQFDCPEETRDPSIRNEGISFYDVRLIC